MHAGSMQVPPLLLSVAVIGASRRLLAAPGKELRSQRLENVHTGEKDLVYRNAATNIAGTHLEDIPNAVDAVVAYRVVCDADLDEADDACSVERNEG